MKNPTFKVGFFDGMKLKEKLRSLGYTLFMAFPEED
jgi:hypothetical protein